MVVYESIKEGMKIGTGKEWILYRQAVKRQEE